MHTAKMLSCVMLLAASFSCSSHESECSDCGGPECPQFEDCLYAGDSTRFGLRILPPAGVEVDLCAEVGVVLTEDDGETYELGEVLGGCPCELSTDAEVPATGCEENEIRPSDRYWAYHTSEYPAWVMKGTTGEWLDVEVIWGDRQASIRVPMKDYNVCGQDVAYLTATLVADGDPVFGEIEYVDLCP